MPGLIFFLYFYIDLCLWTFSRNGREAVIDCKIINFMRSHWPNDNIIIICLRILSITSLTARCLWELLNSDNNTTELLEKYHFDMELFMILVSYVVMITGI